jgi:hypothetical protein
MSIKNFNSYCSKILGLEMDPTDNEILLEYLVCIGRAIVSEQSEDSKTVSFINVTQKDI